MKCSGAPPCTRCQKKSLSCTFPASGSSDAAAEAVAPLQDVQYADPRSEESHPRALVAELQQDQPAPQAMPLQMPRAETFEFPPQAIQTADLMSNARNNHMISSLNWISPNMVFDLAGFDYNQVVSSGEYWGSVADVEPSDQGPASVQSSIALESQSQATPSSFPDSENAETPGTSYVDNRGARQPRNGRYASRIFDERDRRTSSHDLSHVPFTELEPDGFCLNLPAVTSSISPAGRGSRIRPFTAEQYRMMCQAFQDCYSRPFNIGREGQFVPTEVPPIPAFTTMLTLYRENFDPRVIPLIHHDFDSDAESFWVVKLAMAAIGSQYLETEDLEMTIALHEFLRRVLRQQGAVSSTQPLTLESLSLVQAGVLNYIGLAYSGSTRLFKYHESVLEHLVSEYTSLYKSQSATMRDGTSPLAPQDWIVSESTRRLCHTIWLLDTMSRYHFATRPKLLLELAEISLPCKEDLWQASVEQAPVCAKQPTLEEALRVLYVEKRLLKGVGDFARVLIIHGLYCQTWDVARTLDRPLLRWTPSAQKGDAESQELINDAWLPQIPLYNHWRNSACDCLDVLHWIANSDIAQAGTENSTVLHLHFARIVLLAPYQTIREMAKLLVSEDIRFGTAAEKFREQQRNIQRWIINDQFKARLALVHCGVFFWHVRRYSGDAFYEPVKVFLTTLVVWAYGSLCPAQPQTAPPRAAGQSQSEREWSSEIEDISSIRLDRPTDDELVQIFIKRGRSMRATIMGVGNITAAEGPHRMLREGCKLLNTLGKWPFVRNRYLGILTRLIGICGQDRRWLQSGPAAGQPRRLAAIPS